MSRDPAVIENIKKSLQDFPTSPGVYLMKNDREKIIYIGKAKNLRNRVRSYFNKADHSAKTIYLVGHIRTIDYILTQTEVEAFLLEASLIKKHRPRQYALERAPTVPDLSGGLKLLLAGLLLHPPL